MDIQSIMIVSYIALSLRMALALLPFALTLICAGWLMMQSPFSAPLITRSTDQIDAALTRALARNVTLPWLLPRVQEALLLQDLDQLDLLLGLANDHDVLLPRPMIIDIARLDDAQSGLLARTTACGACAVDITACATLAQIGACALPFELTPAGDVNALRRASQNYLSGTDVDQLDLGLALVGLGATGAVLATGGTSYSVKAGASVLRISARLGTLTPVFTAHLSTLIKDAVRWDLLGDLARGRIAPAGVVDSAKLAELTTIGGNLRQIATTTSVAETITLLRHVDTAQDAARLAKVTDAIGSRTRGAFVVLGKSRVYRATVRVSNMAIGAAAALYLLGLQVLVFLTQRAGIACIGALLRRLA